MKPTDYRHWSILEPAVGVWMVVTLWTLVGPVAAPQYCPISHNTDWSAEQLVAVCIAYGIASATLFALITLTVGRLLARDIPIRLTLFPRGFLSQRAIARSLVELIVTLAIVWFVVLFAAPNLPVR